MHRRSQSASPPGGRPHEHPLQSLHSSHRPKVPPSKLQKAFSSQLSVALQTDGKGEGDGGAWQLDSSHCPDPHSQSASPSHSQLDNMHCRFPPGHWYPEHGGGGGGDGEAGGGDGEGSASVRSLSMKEPSQTTRQVAVPSGGEEEESESM